MVAGIGGSSLALRGATSQIVRASTYEVSCTGGGIPA